MRISICFFFFLVFVLGFKVFISFLSSGFILVVFVGLFFLYLCFLAYARLSYYIYILFVASYANPNVVVAPFVC